MNNLFIGRLDHDWQFKSITKLFSRTKLVIGEYSMNKMMLYGLSPSVISPKVIRQNSEQLD